VSPEIAESNDLPEVRWLDVESLRTSLAPLRSSAAPPPQGAPVLAEMPLRVAAREGGAFEVVDGFKRLAHWMTAGQRQVPVLVEQASSAFEQKLLLLRANAPPRRTTAMDEARVIDSIVSEDNLTENAVARRIGRRPTWVSRRRVLAQRLAPSLKSQLDHGQIGPTVAYALCALADKEQEALQHAAERDGLNTQESLALISTFRSATPSERPGLLAHPLQTVRPNPPRPTLGPLCVRLEEHLRRITQALHDVASFEIPTEGLSPGERRRLQAQHLSTLDLLTRTAQAAAAPTSASTDDTQEEDDERRERQDPDDERREPAAGGADPGGDGAPERAADLANAQSRGAEGDPRCVPAPSVDTEDGRSCGPRPQDGPAGPRGGGSEDHIPRPHRPGEQARSLPRDRSGEGRPAAHRRAHPAGDP
jgi:ParB-like chromosome segregation protein Spo0J